MDLSTLYVSGLVKALTKRDEGFGDISFWNKLPKQIKEDLKSFKPIAEFINDDKFSEKTKSNLKIWSEGKPILQEAVDTVWNSTPLDLTFEEWKKSFNKEVLKYNLYEQTTRVAMLLDEDEHELTDDEVASLEKDLTDVFVENSEDDDADNWIDQNQIADAYSEILDYRENHDKLYQFYDTTLDTLIPDGPEPGNGGTIVAATGMGKTAFALNIFVNLLTHGVPCMYFSLEMDKRAILDRMASILSLVPFRNLRNLKYAADKAEIKYRVKKAFEKLKTCNFKIYTGGSINLKKLEREIIKFKKTLPKGQNFVVFIDLISMVDEFINPKNGMTLASQIEFSVNKVNDLSKKYQFHWIGTVQLNKSAEQDRVRNASDIEKLAPSRTSIKNSNAFIERPRWCISLFRRRAYADLYLSPEEAETIPDEIEVNLLKFNNGELQRKLMSYDGPTFKVSSIE